MIADLVYWRIERVSGWQIYDLPSDSLIQFWVEMKKRNQATANENNYSAAILCDLDQAKAEERRTLKPQRWLPYDLGTEQKATILPETAALLAELLAAGSLPPKMERDLKGLKLIL